MTSTQRSVLLITGLSGVIAIVSVLPILEIVPDTPPFGYMIVLAVPGIVFSAAVSRNIHSFSSWLVVLFNWIFYAVIFIALRKVMRVAREK
jgi:hypothetical protein